MPTATVMRFFTAHKAARQAHFWLHNLGKSTNHAEEVLRYSRAIMREPPPGIEEEDDLMADIGQQLKAMKADIELEAAAVQRMLPDDLLDYEELLELPLMEAIRQIESIAGTETSQNAQRIAVDCVLYAACRGVQPYEGWYVAPEVHYDASTARIRRRLSEIEELKEQKRAAIAAEERKMLDAVLELVVSSRVAQYLQVPACT